MEGEDMQTITPFLWFDGRAEEAMNFYVSVFENSKIVSVSRYGEGGPGPAGSVMIATLEINGQQIMAFNGGPEFKFSHAFSLFVSCETQEEVDYLWERLTEGGEEVQCGWLTDRFGLSWQIVPNAFGELMQGGTPEQSARVMAAMLQMKKLEIAGLRRAFDGV
jgi:predicted 3-demethylubiquinone-9 3-methyltransferase (glyoxalase superfamily)